MINNALLNDIFLNSLFKQTNREIYARITVLTQKEEAIEYIQGKISAGSINVDGKSAIRRSCSLTVVAKDIEINEFYWGIKNKFKLEVGLLNEINNSYEDIIWFPQGIFLITNFDTNYTTKNCQISIKGKDKMCLLNGEFSGHLPHNTDFGKEDYHDLVTDTLTTTDIPVQTIIREAVRNFGNEQPYNIIINDIDEAGLELLEYRGNVPLYMLRDINSDIFTNITFNQSQECFYTDDQGYIKTTVISDSENIIYDNLVNLDGALEPTRIIFSMVKVDNMTEEKFNSGIYYENISTEDTEAYILITKYNPEKVYYQARNEYYVAKFDYGSSPGYRLTELTYPGELISKAGETVVTLLDKIKKMLGDFEYFYNLDGKFVFQKKKKYNATNWHNAEIDEVLYNDATINMEKPIFSLLDNELITSFKNSPKITNLKNDYSIWGNRKTSSGTDVPIHARYAIDIKPKYYKNYDGKIYISDKALLDQIKESFKQVAVDQVNQELMDFTPKYSVNPILEKPKKLTDGSWTPGWWDIRDWAAYYKLLTGSDKDPEYTMKWYSRGDETGYQLITTRWYSSLNESSRYVWLIIERPDGQLNSQHGGSLTIDTDEKTGIVKTSKRYKYRSWINSLGELKTEKVVPEEIKYFSDPYRGCSDNHTYLSFLKDDIETDGCNVYFYNPDFPSATFEDLVVDKTESEFQELLNSGLINFVDWREVIYQMSLDYNKHYHDDDFLYQVANNNPDYYPSGITGYERYYVDINGFWRDLYDPNAMPTFETVSYLTASKYQVDNNLYIMNSYRKLADIEKDELIVNIEDIYVLDSSRLTKLSENLPSEEIENIMNNPDIIPFLGSEYCHLNYRNKYSNNLGQTIWAVDPDLEKEKWKFEYTDKTISEDIYFYVNEDNIMTDGTENPDELNRANLSDIYIKNRGPFITNEGYDEEEKTDIRKYYYVRGFPQIEGDDSEDTVVPDGTIPENALYTKDEKLFKTYDGKIFLIRRAPVAVKKSHKVLKQSEENYSKYQFWVFKYPIGTQLDQYADDYTSYAGQKFEEYLNKYDWDNLYIKTKEPIKFQDLDQPIQRLYYKQAGILTENLNLLQYNNFHELKTNYSDFILQLSIIDPSTFTLPERYIEEIEILSEKYVGAIDDEAKAMIAEIATLDIYNYENENKYYEDLQSYYNQYIQLLYDKYTIRMNEPHYLVEPVQYKKAVYNFNTDSDNGDFWSKLISSYPEQLNFWFDFINGENSFLSKYSVQTLGPRTKVVNDNNVKAIYYKEVPNTIFITSDREYEKYSNQTGYTYIQLPNEMAGIFTVSARGKTAKSVAEDLIYENCYATETATIQTVPIYHLEPNTCIYIRNDETNINGDYLISKLTVPLDQKKMMSITATKVMPSIL